MSKWARAENNIVVETTDIDPTGRFTPELVAQFIECPEEVEQGWQYLNGIFSERVMQYVIRNSTYLYDYYQSGDIVVTEQPASPNTYTFYKWATTSAIAGKRSYTITTNFVTGDALSLCGVTLTLGTDVIGTDIATTATNLQIVLSANTTINALYTVTVSGSIFTLTEITAGGGNTPSEATTTGTGVITNSTATTSTTSTTGWKIDLATSLDALNSSYSAPKLEIHKQHSGVILANWLTSDQILIAEDALKIAYKTLHDDLKSKQEALANG
jgi:hypothetical protein